MAAYSTLGLVGTIAEEDDVPIIQESSESEEDAEVAKQKKKKKKTNEFNNNFEFTDKVEIGTGFDADFAYKFAKKKQEASTLDEKIARIRRKKKKTEAGMDTGGSKDSIGEDNETVDNNVGSEEEEIDEDIESSDEEMLTDKLRVKEKRKKKKKKLEEEEEKEMMSYAESIDSYDEKLTFQDMNVSRPLLKGLASMNFDKPTPIQSATIPVALLGKDICACAVTGSGKTVAFMLPIMERLLYRPIQTAVTRVLVLVPTRELAVQVYTVSRQLAQFSDIEICLSAGGMDLKTQAAALRRGPDVVVATPGRLIDHLHNSACFTLNNIEILVLDEADRMLDEYFAEQMKEVIRLCARSRQTMLFSATMTEEVQDLAAVSLKNPVKIFVNENTDVALGLRQEFVRIRTNREGDREAIVAALVSRTFRDHCIVFIQTKKQAHRMHIVLGLLGLKVGELHGNLSQAQRLEALKLFKESQIDILLATDLAARGLDIEGVKTIINFTMPNTMKHYIHRVGRTARAGKSGRAVTLVGEKERKLLKEVVKKAKQLKARLIPQDVIGKYRDKISSLEDDVQDVEKMEEEEKELRATENQMNKVKHILEKEKEGGSNQKRIWFQTHKQRMQEKATLRLTDKLTKKQKKKLSDKETPEDRVGNEIKLSLKYMVRASKKDYKPKRIRACSEVDYSNWPPGGKQQKKTKTGVKRKSAFDQELTNTGQKALKQFRAGPSYKERKDLGLIGKKKNQQNKGKRKR